MRQVRVIHKQVAGLDVHKKTVVATRMQVTDEGRLEWQTETFGTTTPDLLKLHDWLLEWSLSHVAMESTGDFWKPVFNVLEGSFEVVLTNAQHVHNLPGRKTDAKDSEWLAELMLYGLLKASFIPPKPQRALRDLTRYRTTLVQEHTRLVNRVQKLLEGANIKLASVATDLMGVSARAMLAEIAAGQTDVTRMANLARARLRNKIPELEKALTGLVEPHHRFLLAQQLEHIDYLDEKIEELNGEIEGQLAAMSNSSAGPQAPSDEARKPEDSSPGGEQKAPLTWDKAVTLLDTIPGINQRAAEDILAEIGIDMSRFPTDKHLASWTGRAPGNNQSGGKRFSGRRPRGNKPAGSILTEVSHAASRTKNTFLNARYHRLAARRGKKRALGAISHSIIVAIWHILTYQEPYHELGGDYYDQRQKDTKVDYLIRRLERLTGGAVSIELQPIAA